MTASAPADLLVQPAYLTHPPYESTLGPEVADLCEMVGFTPDPEQRLGLDLIFAMRPDGKSLALEVAAVCSRQNLKTGLFKMAVLGWLFITDQRLVVWSAHEFNTAQEAFRDLKELIEGHPSLSKRLKPGRTNGISEANGEEGIELLGDRRLRFKARTKTGGRGLSGDKIVLDEAFALKPGHMGALFPTLSARPDPQVLYGSSAGGADSDVLRAVRDRGRSGGSPRLAYVEWCDDLPGSCLAPNCSHEPSVPGCRLDDRRRWRRANPAMGRRITEDYIAAEREALPPAEFARERLGWWEEDERSWPVIPEGIWRSRHIDPVKPERPAFAVAASWPDGGFYSIGVAGVAAGQLVVQLVDHRQGRAWVPGMLEQLRAANPGAPVVMRDRGPTAALHADLSRDGFQLVTPWIKESAAAFAAFHEAALDGQPLPLGHFDQDVLNDAVAAADRQPASDGWVWTRKGHADVSPVEAVTLACWGHLNFTNERVAEPMIDWL